MQLGFQGQESNDKWNGEGNMLAFKYRIHDARLGRFLSIDPLAPDYPWNSPYAFSENRVIDGVELEGLEKQTPPKPAANLQIIPTASTSVLRSYSVNVIHFYMVEPAPPYGKESFGHFAVGIQRAGCNQVIYYPAHGDYVKKDEFERVSSTNLADEAKTIDWYNCK